MKNGPHWRYAPALQFEVVGSYCKSVCVCVCASVWCGIVFVAQLNLLAACILLAIINSTLHSTIHHVFPLPALSLFTLR